MCSSMSKSWITPMRDPCGGGLSKTHWTAYGSSVINPRAVCNVMVSFVKRARSPSNKIKSQRESGEIGDKEEWRMAGPMLHHTKTHSILQSSFSQEKQRENIGKI